MGHRRGTQYWYLNQEGRTSSSGQASGEPGPVGGGGIWRARGELIWSNRLNNNSLNMSRVQKSPKPFTKNGDNRVPLSAVCLLWWSSNRKAASTSLATVGPLNEALVLQLLRQYTRSFTYRQCNACVQECFKDSDKTHFLFSFSFQQQKW